MRGALGTVIVCVVVLSLFGKKSPHYLMPRAMVEELGPLLRPGATLDVLFVDDGYVRRGEDHWSLYRPGSSGPPPSAAAARAGPAAADQDGNRRLP